MVDKSPAQDKLLQREVRVWEPKEHRPTLTWSRSGYKPYSTYVEVLISRHGSANSNTESRTSTLRGRPLLRHASRDSVSFVSIVYIKSNQWFESAANSIDRKLVNHVAPFLAPGNMDLRLLTRTAQGGSGWLIDAFAKSVFLASCLRKTKSWFKVGPIGIVPVNKTAPFRSLGISRNVSLHRAIQH